ncbi:hypothetical protein RB597_009259 [Gaeumannomyces tritici]
MGNVNSAEAPRRVAPASNKLVKPRMTSVAAPRLPNLNASQPSCDDALPSSPGLVRGRPFSSSHPFSVPPLSPSVPFPQLDVDFSPYLDPLDDDIDYASASMVAEPIKKERSLRRIFRSRSSSTAQPSRRGSPERRNTTAAAAAAPLPPLEGQGVAPPTRCNSMLGASDALYRDQSTTDSWNIADSRVSWNYNLTSYEAKRLLNLAQGDATGIQDEISAAVSENKFSVVSEVTWKSSHPPLTETAASVALSRANSDLSLYTPVRRRSVIQTPGLATRRSASRPPLSSQRYSHPPTPSLSRQASSDSVGSRVLSMPPLPSRMKVSDEVRGPVTPCEGDYQTIGAFKLGTLRIMNGTVSPGAVSPEPDKKRRVRHPAVPPPTAKEASYFTPVPAVESERARKGIRRDVDLTIRTDAPIPPPNAPSVVGHAARLLRSPTAAIRSPVAASSVSPSLLQVGGSEGLRGADGQYLGQIQFSPFSIAGDPPSSPLVTTSKANELEDHLFDDDAQSEYSTLEVLDLRLDPNAKSEPTVVSPNSAGQGSKTGDGSTSSNPNSGLSHKPLTKTDSGYCSNVSLRSLRSSSRDVSWRSGDGKRTSLSSPLGIAPSEGQVLSSTAIPPSPQRGPPPTPPPKDFVHSPRAGVSGSRALSQPLAFEAKSRAGTTTTPDKSLRRESASAAMGSTWTVAPQSPDSAMASPSSTGSAGSASKLSSSRGSQKGGRLHRLLSRGDPGRSQAVSAPQPTHVSKSANSASASREGHRKLRTHSGQFHMKVKKLDLKSQASKDTLKTIMSVGSLEARAVEAAQNGEVAFDSPGKSRRHTSYTPSALGQVASAGADMPPVPELTPTKPSRTMSVARKPLPVWKDRHTLAVDTSSGYLALNGDSITGSISRSPTMITRSPSKIFDKDYRDELHFSPSVTEISIISPLAIPSPTEDDQPSPPSPVVPELMSRKRVGATSPPVSRRTRNQGNLRVPALLRPKSTTPSPAHSAMLPQEQDAASGSVHHQEALQQLTGASAGVPQAPLSAPMQPRRSMTLELRSSRSFSRAPDWQVKTDHDTSRRSSMEVRPEDPLRALEVVVAEQGHAIRRHSSAQPPSYVISPQESPQLRHRASYDDRTRPQMRYLPSQQQLQQHPSIPVTDPRWYRQSSDAYGQQQQQQQYRSWQPQTAQQQQLERQHQWNQWHEQQYRDQSPQWDQQQQQQQQGHYSRPHVARGGHGRNNSLGSPDRQGQPGVPYRILHSYNSPAYRNAPIWG